MAYWYAVTCVMSVFFKRRLFYSKLSLFMGEVARTL